MHLSTWTSFKWRGNQARGFFFSSILFYFILFFNFTILYWFWNISTWICHRYTCAPHPSGSSQCTSPKHPVLRIEPGLATHFVYDIIHVKCSVHSLWLNWLWPSGLQHTRLPCPLPTPRTRWNSCPSIQWCHPTIRSSVIFLLLPSVFPRISIFSNDSVLLIRWPKYQLLSFSISHPNEYSRMSSFRIDRFDLLIVLPFLSYVIGTDRFWRKLWFCWRCSILESTS